MRIFLKQNVLEAALDRIRYIFDEFPVVIASVSGGKDSTVIFNLALKVAREKNRLPLKVLFLDQEAEWDSVITTIREIMTHPDVEPLWLQMPFRLFNATSPIEPWLHCWDESKKEHWIRPKEPNSIKVNRYGTERFKEMFGNFLKVEFQGQKVCYLAGVRTEESPTRFLALTASATYKHITWGKKFAKNREHYSFYPIYDWSFKDVWKAIHEHGWPYCKLYDYMYQHGIPTNNMRVSNVHHETAINTLFFLQEIEPKTWNRISTRLAGLNTANQMNKENYYVYELPPMFKDWKEYRDHLLENLILDPKLRASFRKEFARLDKRYRLMNEPDQLYKTQVNSILANDFEFTKLSNWERSPEAHFFRKWARGDKVELRNNGYERYIPKDSRGRLGGGRQGSDD